MLFYVFEKKSCIASIGNEVLLCGALFQTTLADIQNYHL